MELTEHVLDSVNDACRFIRETVFVEEQGFEEEFDTLDQTAVHFLITVDGGPAATARMMTGSKDGEYIVGRVAVLPEYRNMRIGSRLMRLTEREALRRGGTKISLSAQHRACAFYESLGYSVSGPSFFEQSCEHIPMEKQLNG